MTGPLNSQSGGSNQTSAPGQPLNPAQVNPGSIKSSGFSASNYFATIDTLNPPAMKTFVYSPATRIIISHGGVEYDVSDDMVRCQLIRPENSAASFSATLQNKNLRYTPQDRPRFFPMDRIVVYMKKIEWLQVFSGYLDTVPYRHLYPGVIEIQATCTMKRLMHSWWNPDLKDATAFYDSSLHMQIFGDTIDAGLGGLLTNLLHVVGGWNYENIHIQEFPMQFFTFLLRILPGLNQVDQANILKLKQMVLGNANASAPGAFAGSNPNAGSPGPEMGITGEIGGLADAPVGSAWYITQIVAACDEKGLGPIPYDNNLSAGLVQAGTTGEAARDPKVQKAFQQVQQTNLDAQQANRNTDGAILGVAAAMVDSGGGGVTIRNCYNPAVPGSESFPNDGPNFNGTAVGIFGQPSGPEYGNLAQRMNPKQAAGMFMANLGTINWRTMDPGSACQMVQRTSNAAPYDAAIEVATKLVQGYRTFLGSAATTVIPGGGTMVGNASSLASAAGLGGAPSQIPNAVTSTGAAGPGPATLGTLNPARANKPQPDSEGAINWAMTQLGLPYHWGSTGPLAYDCCHPSGTMIFGPKGARQIQDLEKDDLVWSFADGALTANSVKAAWKSTTQATFKVRTRNRNVVASANHPFLRLSHHFDPATLDAKGNDGVWSFDWVRLDELRRGDHIVTFQGTEESIAYSDSIKDSKNNIPEDLAWFMGVWIGDGCLNQDSIRVCVFGKLREECQNVVYRHWGTKGQHHPRAGLIINKASAVRWMRFHGFTGKSHEKVIPKIVWEWTSDLQAAFLLGYIAADGCRISRQSEDIKYGSASKQLINDVRALHILLGDGVSNVHKEERKKPIVIKGKEVKEARPRYDFTVRYDLRAASSLSGGNGKRARAARQLVKSLDPAFGVQRVLSITEEGVQDTYDIEVEGAHNFIADGLVVHNSGLVMSAFKSIGIYTGRTTDEMRTYIGQIPNNAVQRGDIVEPTSGHVVLWCGDGTIIEASTEGVPIHRIPNPYGPPSNWFWVGRVCSNGGVDPSAPFNPPQTMGPGQPPSAIAQVNPSGQAAGTQFGSDGVAYNLFSYFTGGFASEQAAMLGGRKAFIDGQPLINAIQAVANAGLRSWSSAPNGDFIAWYPDYWGLDGKPAVLRLEDIELKDCRIDLSDDPLTTHVYVRGDYMQGFGVADEFTGWLSTRGIVTIEDPDMWLWRRLATVSPVDDGLATGEQILKRYGVRPLNMHYAAAGTPELEFLLACQVFMSKWAQRFQTEISMTFMPELFPGMRVELAGHKLQVYVTSVTHVCDTEQGYHTQATIVAPSSPYSKALMETVNTASPTNQSMTDLTGFLSNLSGGR